MEKAFQIPSPRDLRFTKMATHLAERALATHMPVDQLTKDEELIAASSAILLSLSKKIAGFAKTTLDTAKNPDVEFWLEGKLEVSKLYEGGRKLSSKEVQVYYSKVNAQLRPGEKSWRLPSLLDLQIMQNASLFDEHEWIWGYDTSCANNWIILQPSDGVFLYGERGSNCMEAFRLVRDM